MRFRGIAVLAVCLAACTPSRVPPPEVVTPAPAEEPALVFPHAHVWTAEADAQVRTLAGPITVPRLFTRLEVLGADSMGLRVRCTACPVPGAGWIDTAAVIFAPSSPLEAARGELADFLLALREAAAQRDVDALRPVMAINFTHSFRAGEGRLEAVASWEQTGFHSLQRMPELLDRGVATRDGVIWAAPPEYVEEPGYQDLRAGFRRSNAGQWEWIFLVSPG